jgi:hypothetical protein
MPAHIRREPDDLLVIFSRDGERDDARLVADGHRAASIATMMIAGHAPLLAGDQLTVQRYEPGDELAS